MDGAGRTNSASFIVKEQDRRGRWPVGACGSLRTKRALAEHYSRPAGKVNKNMMISLAYGPMRWVVCEIDHALADARWVVGEQAHPIAPRICANNGGCHHFRCRGCPGCCHGWSGWPRTGSREGRRRAGSERAFESRCGGVSVPKEVPSCCGGQLLSHRHAKGNGGRHTPALPDSMREVAGMMDFGRRKASIRWDAPLSPFCFVSIRGNNLRPPPRT